MELKIMENIRKIRNKVLKKEDPNAKKKIKDPRGEPIPVPKDPTLKDK